MKKLKIRKPRHRSFYHIFSNIICNDLNKNSLFSPPIYVADKLRHILSTVYTLYVDNFHVLGLDGSLADMERSSKTFEMQRLICGYIFRYHPPAELEWSRTTLLSD